MGRKNGEEREIFVECGLDLSSARGLTYKPFLSFLKERKRKKKKKSDHSKVSSLGVQRNGFISTCPQGIQMEVPRRLVLWMPESDFQQRPRGPLWRRCGQSGKGTEQWIN